MSVYKILLADDEIALRFLLTETLSDEGYAILPIGIYRLFC
jgi:hypothetical protein